MTFHIDYPRVVPERRPPGHEPAAPRYTLRWTRPVNRLCCVYLGIQGRELAWDDQASFFSRIRDSFVIDSAPEAHETLRFTDEAGYTNAVLVAYWTDPSVYMEWLRNAAFIQWLAQPQRTNDAFGYWRETIHVHYDRHETIYSEGNYRIGFGRCPDTQVVLMTTNGYFGAARDRFPVSAVDPLVSTFNIKMPEAGSKATFGRRLFAQVPHNLTSIRSGQYWGEAKQEQFDDYEESLRPKLMEGMQYLLDNKEETGTLCLRVMSNLDDDGDERYETSVHAYFASLEEMEDWASSHPTHKAIYDHAIAKNREYGKKREVVTWHEVFLLTEGVPFEYINCHPDTGVLPFCTLYERSS